MFRSKTSFFVVEISFLSFSISFTCSLISSFLPCNCFWASIAKLFKVSFLSLDNSSNSWFFIFICPISIDNSSLSWLTFLNSSLHLNNSSVKSWCWLIIFSFCSFRLVSLSIFEKFSDSETILSFISLEMIRCCSVLWERSLLISLSNSFFMVSSLSSSLASSFSVELSIWSLFSLSFDSFASFASFLFFSPSFLLANKCFKLVFSLNNSFLSASKTQILSPKWLNSCWKVWYCKLKSSSWLLILLDNCSFWVIKLLKYISLT